MKTICALPFLLICLYLAPAAHYLVIPLVEADNVPQVTTAPRARVYSQGEIDELTSATFHPFILRKLIKCESENTNVARMDSNGLVSFGLLQFNGTSTWAEFAPLAHATGSSMNPASAIKVADWMISNGLLKRWSCAKSQGLL